MGRPLSLLSLFCLAVLLSGHLTNATATLYVNESTTRILLEDEQTLISLAVENSIGRRVNGRIKLEIIDPRDQVCAAIQREEGINPGAQKLLIPFSIQPKSAADPDKFLWYRLRYRISPIEPAEINFETVSGVIAFSEITPDVFQLSAVAPRYARAGQPYRTRVRAKHPLTSWPIKGVNVEAVLKFDGDDNEEITLRQSVKTGADGYATLDFTLPRNIETDEGELKVTARHGVLEKSVETEVHLNYWVTSAINTDKPIYQPGQTLHIRVLAFDPARRALVNEDVTLKILDPEGETVSRFTAKTSRFGVTSVDWPIPENTKLGTYELEATFDNPRYGESRSSSRVKISRYELPNFSVIIKTDGTFYLPGNNAEVEVRAEYLFGQPVKRGHVRVVRETERKWNYREQEWETEEGDKYEGDTDTEGRFVAHVNLTEEHKELADESYSRFRDLSYAAYFTDPTTNRTEQRRFDLRITKEAIHVYFVEGSGWQSRDLPLEFYVTTFRADGTPAQCEVTLSQTLDKRHGSVEKILRTIKTNPFGLAKVTDLELTNDHRADDRSLNLVARDQKGNTGRHTEGIYYSDSPVIRVSTEKVIYRPGEPVRIQINANRPDMKVIVDVLHSTQVIYSELVQLREGQAALVLPYNREFKNDITVSVYSVSEPDSSKYDFPYDSSTVIYPHNRDFRLQVGLNQTSYRPGEDATIDFLARSTTGAPSESALGVVIFDKAVEERARTDREFGGAYGFYDAYCHLKGGVTAIAGITRQSLDQIDLTKRIPDGLDLVAEMLLNDSSPPPLLLRSETDNLKQTEVFSALIKEKLKPFAHALEAEYNKHQIYPTDETTLRRLLSTAGHSFDELRDPWDMPYVFSFFVDQDHDVMEVRSSGPDKKVGSSDDFSASRVKRPYFRFTGEAIDRAVGGYHARTGRYIRDVLTLKSELLKEGINLDALHDPWGQSYAVKFGVSQKRYSVEIASSGPDKRFSTDNDGDDFNLWTSWIDYSTDIQASLDRALGVFFKATSRLPANVAEFNAVLNSSGINQRELLDPWGRQFYATFKDVSRYGDHVTILSQARYGEQLKEKTEITPVTQTISSLFLQSSGPDGKEGTQDDFDVAIFSRITSEQSRSQALLTTTTPTSNVVLKGATGAITGTVTDSQGVAIPGVTVTATNGLTAVEYEATSNDDGVYIVKNLPAGIYQLRFSAASFKNALVTEVRVRSSNITELNVTLEVAGVMETVTVTAAANPMQTQQTNASGASRETGVAKTASSTGNQVSTPRLREYFPETLVWQPSLETDQRGRAQLKFKLADNITTWKISVIGSTEDGQIGTVEKEFLAFQPFFVEHEPPRILTEGDEISLPVVVRNYLDRAQLVELAIKTEPWFELLGAAQQNVNVAAGEAERQTFDLRTTASVKDGKQRITAQGVTDRSASDAIEKPVTVHPDGQELTVTASDIVNQSTTLQFNIPEQAIANSQQATLKIYPNLMAHVIEGIEAIMERPYGCGEQTISSTYPSLLLLRHHKQTGQEFPERARAERYLQTGYNRLLNYRAGNGGFGYWKGSEPDVALTAYALRFFLDAQDLIDIEDEVISQAHTWLLRQQSDDGSWPVYDYGSRVADQRRTALLTAYVARVLAMMGSENAKATDEPTRNPSERETKINRAFDYLSRRVNEIDEPYLLASYALGALELGHTARFESAAARLQSLSHREGNLTFWALQTNTPFYGWGLAGRVETTALVIQALARRLPAPAPIAPVSQTNDELIRSGLLFLLKQKDRYGVWYSTQATINVFDTLLTLLQKDSPVSGSISSDIEIVINGRVTQNVPLPPAGKLVSPILVDVSRFIQTGPNRIEIRRNGIMSLASAQVIASYYVPWPTSHHSTDQRAGDLRLVTKFDKTQGKVSAEINCHVEVERLGHRGYGMLLAEIGLPPGADVDRASLETAIKNSNWAITQYDVLPDRVIVYLWPRAGGVTFDFKFRPRFGLKAKTAPSVVYDYYNPEARAVVAPAVFTIK